MKLKWTLAAPSIIALVAVPVGAVRAATAQTPQRLTSSLYTLVAAPDPSFVWYPKVPQVGERVTLVSTSTDFVSPIASYGWDLTGFGEFAAGGQAITTTFTTPASHSVRMLVTAADGRSSTTAETIHMDPGAADVMNPFPVVRIVGIDYSYGTKIRVLAVDAPPRARITVECRGRGCPVKAVRRVVPTSRRPLLAVGFRRFERLLRPGATLRIRVSDGTDIGAYTRFTIRHRGLPVRIDSCLNRAGVKPILCPT
jgi:hypothetical protein